MRARSTTQGRVRRSLIATGALTLSVLVAVPLAFAADEVGFELDTDTDNDGTGTTVDWEDFVATDAAGDAQIDPSVTLPLVGTGDEGGITISAVGADADHFLPDTTTFTTGSKDTLDINPGWECSQSNNVSNKVDLLNVYSAAGYVGDELHLFFGMERSSNNGDANIAMWFLLDETVGCEASGPGGGGTETFTGNHENGDILLVSAFTNGGTQAEVTAYIWVDGALVEFESGANCDPGVADQNLCAVANDDPVNTPWNSPTSDKSDDDILAANQFYEGGINLTAALAEAAGPGGPLDEVPGDQCFATFLGNTRSSTSLTATLFDYSGGSLPVCGGLEVNKYLDVDESGSADTSASTVDLFSQSDITSVLTGGADEFGSNTDLAGWAIEVWATNGTPDTGDDDQVCSGTTDVDGSLSCTTGTLANLLPGDYRIVETSVPADWQNTDQATGDGKIVTVGLGGDTQAYVGNTCLVAVEFEVTGIPTDATAPSSMTAAWEVTAGPNLGASGTETLTVSGSTATGTTSNQFSISNTVKWDFYVDGDATKTQEGSSGVSLASDGYPDCLAESTQAYPNVDLLGFKYKDMNADGVHDAGEPGLGGWTFKLFASDANVASDTPLQTVQSSSAATTLGEYTFTDVAPGSYKVVEVVQSNWVQSGPLDASDAVVTEVAITVPFDATSAVSIDDVGNTPLSRVKMEFEDLTGSTDATIDCDWTTEDPDTDPDVDTSGESDETAEVEASDLKIGTYSCTVVITDP